MKSVCFCFTVDDVGLEHYSSEQHLANLLEFCRQEQVKATFFVVPRPDGRDFRTLPDYLRLLQQAEAEGHEIAQHGLEHDRFECGIPPQMILDLPHEGPSRDRLAQHRAEIDALHTVDRLREMLHTGRGILENALEHTISGFRAPCASKCGNLFRALAAEGYRYDSSHILQEAAWDLWNGRSLGPPRPITRRIFDAMQTDDRLRCLPMAAEYAWYLRQSQYDTVRDLARNDFDACAAVGIPFVSLCHVSPVQQGDGDLGLTLFRELFAHARASAERRGLTWVSATMTEACAAWDAGELT